MPYLVQKRIDGSKIKEWELSNQRITLGRGEEADLRFNDDRASRLHCAVLVREGVYVVEDLNSTNGTWVNNERITEVQLKPNDKVRLGQTVLVYEIDKPKGIVTVMVPTEDDAKVPNRPRHPGNLQSLHPFAVSPKLLETVVFT